MQKSKTKNALIFPIHLSIFYRNLEVRKTKAKKKHIHHQKMTFRNNYYLNMMEVPRVAQVCINENLIFRMKSNEKRL